MAAEFPHDDSISAFPGVQTERNQYPYGMSLRDYFAAKAMTALIDGHDHEIRQHSENKNERTGFDDNPNEDSDATYASLLAVEAYIIADAMLEVRKEKPLNQVPLADVIQQIKSGALHPAD